MVDGFCWRCIYFNALDPEDTVTEATGECRRFPPQRSDFGDGELSAAYPPTGWTEWCGEFELDDEK